MDQSANTFAPAGVAELTQVQAEDDTSTVFGQVSGQRLGQAVAANGLGGSGQTWQAVTGSRAYGTVYQNTTDSPIAVAITQSQSAATGSGKGTLAVSDDNVTFIDIAKSQGGAGVVASLFGIVPPNHYYRATVIDTDLVINVWSELR